MKLIVDCYVTSYMTSYMTCYESGRISCANQALFLGPVVGSGRVAGSAMHLPLIRCCDDAFLFAHENSLFF